MRAFIATEAIDSVIDIGCGRGEFLETMREAKITAAALDAGRDLAQFRTREVPAVDGVEGAAEDPDPGPGPRRRGHVPADRR